MPKWNILSGWQRQLVRIGKYFGVVSEKDADEWTEDDYQPFYFDMNSEGEIFAVAGYPEDGDEEEILD